MYSIPSKHTSELSGGKKNYANFYSVIGWVICREQKDTMHFDENENSQLSEDESNKITQSAFLQQLKLIPSFYGFHVLVCMPDNIRACSEMS